MNEPQISYQFDSQRWLEQCGYLNRKLLFLDLNFWIRLVKESTPTQLELKERLTTLVSSERILCPISPSMIMEVGKQPRSEYRDSQTNLMDELSCGLAIKLPPRVFPVEYKSESEGRHASRELIYSHFMDAMAETPLSLEGHPGLPEPLARLAAELVLDSQTKLSITKFMAESFNRTEGSFPGGDSSSLRMNDAFSEKAAEWEKWKCSNTMTMEDIERSEFHGLLSEILPGILIQEPAARTHDRIAEVSKECPTCWCTYKAMAVLRNRGGISGNDIWDVLHAGTAIPYVDCLACDRGTRNIYADRLKADERFGTRIVSNESGLSEWLSDIE